MKLDKDDTNFSHCCATIHQEEVEKRKVKEIVGGGERAQET